MKPAPEHNRLSAFNGTLRTDCAPKPQPAKVSWWLTPKAQQSREGFDEVHVDEQKRMASSSESAKVPIRVLDTI